MSCNKDVETHLGETNRETYTGHAPPGPRLPSRFDQNILSQRHRGLSGKGTVLLDDWERHPRIFSHRKRVHFREEQSWNSDLFLTWPTKSCFTSSITSCFTIWHKGRGWKVWVILLLRAESLWILNYLPENFQLLSKGKACEGGSKVWRKRFVFHQELTILILKLWLALL